MNWHMDSDTLKNIIPVIVLIIWGIVGALTKKATKRPPAPPPHRPRVEPSPQPAPSSHESAPSQRTESPAPAPQRPREVLRKTLADVLAEIEQATGQELGVPDTDARPAETPLDAQPAAFEMERAMEQTPATATGTATIENAPTPESLPVAAATIALPTPPVNEPPTLPQTTWSLPGDLRAAIVWSEVLGKPVSLRTEDARR